ncbi:MAG: AI-2E family transporter [Bacilli bacterium]|nr:AI-2E family transporter [Bacilli bacterium]
MLKNKLNYKLINVLLVILIVSLLYWISGLWLGIVRKGIDILLPFVLGFAVAYALYPIQRKLEDSGFPKWLAVFLIYFILVGFIILIGIIVLPMFYDQMVLFLGNISTVVTDISSKYELDLGILETSISDISGDILRELGGQISNGAITFVNTSISVFTNIIVMLIVSVYFLYDMTDIRKKLKKKLKLKKNRSYDYVKRLDVEVNNYFLGLIKNIIIQFFEYTIVFFLIGHPNWLILGILAAVTTIIPYFGGLIINIIALVIASIISTKLFILTLIVCIICPNIDGYIVGPKVYGKTNQLHPLINIFAVFAGGVLGGFWGIVISLPIVIIIIATYKFFKEDIDNKIMEMKEIKN